MNWKAFATTIAVLICTVGAGEAAKRNIDLTRRYPITTGDRLVVDAAGSKLVVRVADIEEAVITSHLRISGVSQETADAWVDAVTPQVTRGEGQLGIVVSPAKKGTLSLAHLTAKARLLVAVPGAVVPDLTARSGDISVRGDFASADPLRLRTAGGRMEMTGAAASLDIRSTSGDARIVVVRPLARLFARTASGNVSVTGGLREAHVDTASGDISLDGLSGPVDLSTSSGKVFLRWDRLDTAAEVHIRSTKGRVEIVIPDTVDPSGELRTTTGEVRCELPATVTEEGHVVTLNGTGPRFDVESTSGLIILGHGTDGWQVSPSSSPE